MQSISVDRDTPGGETTLRFAEHVHTAPAGATVRLLGRDHHPRVAIVAHPSQPPYFVFMDGHTEEIETRGS